VNKENAQVANTDTKLEDHPLADSRLIFMTEFKHDPLARGGSCFCDRCEAISYYYKMRKMERAILESKYYNSHEYSVEYTETKYVDGKMVEVPRRDHDRDYCSRIPGTFCAEVKVFKNAWTIFLANLDMEAYAWRKLVDEKLGTSNYSIEGFTVFHEYEKKTEKDGKVIKTETVTSTYDLRQLLADRIERIKKQVANLRKDAIYSDYSIGNTTTVSPFAELKDSVYYVAEAK